MKLSKVVNKIIEEIEEETKPEYKEELFQEFKERELYSLEENLNKLDNYEAAQFLKILRKLTERWDYGMMRSCTEITGGSEEQFKRILKLIRTHEDICSIIDALAESGYDLPKYGYNNDQPYFGEEDYNFFTEFIKGINIQEYIQTLNALKELWGYQPKNKKEVIIRIKEISKIEKAKDAIYILANEGFNLSNQNGELNFVHIKGIKDIAQLLKEGSLKDFDNTASYLYKTNITLFQKYFNSLPSQEQKQVIENLRPQGIEEWLNHRAKFLYERERLEVFQEYFSELFEKEEKQAIQALKEIFKLSKNDPEKDRWLNEKYHELVQKASFE